MLLVLPAGLAAPAWRIWAAGTADAAAPADPITGVGSGSVAVVLPGDGPTSPPEEATAAAAAVAHPLKPLAAQVLPAASGLPSASVAGPIPAVQLPPVPLPASRALEAVVNTSVANEAAATVATVATTAAALPQELPDPVPAGSRGTGTAEQPPGRVWPGAGTAVLTTGGCLRIPDSSAQPTPAPGHEVSASTGAGLIVQQLKKEALR
ncbi:hypothetical protein ACQCSU_20745 [Pseudarthrobacter sp. O4]|uniref:hypothetical protein n=1 Tax=Pseudarthrobacter sp. O4 TaxID=3418417 RepID=UPI003CF30600